MPIAQGRTSPIVLALGAIWLRGGAVRRYNVRMALDADAFRRLCRARELLCERCERTPSVREVARATGMSHFHFIRQFEAVFGATPHQLRIRSRLDRAKQLLALGQHSVTEVCFEIGFESLGSFSVLFARRIGEPPSAYRRRVRRMVAVPGTLPAEAFPGCLSLMRYFPADAFGGAGGAAMAARAVRNSREA
jgi:AraC-like DNA-binding protein